MKVKYTSNCVYLCCHPLRIPPYAFLEVLYSLLSKGSLYCFCWISENRLSDKILPNIVFRPISLCVSFLDVIESIRLTGLSGRLIWCLTTRVDIVHDHVCPSSYPLYGHQQWFVDVDTTPVNSLNCHNSTLKRKTRNYAILARIQVVTVYIIFVPTLSYTPCITVVMRELSTLSYLMRKLSTLWCNERVIYLVMQRESYLPCHEMRELSTLSCKERVIYLVM